MLEVKNYHIYSYAEAVLGILNTCFTSSLQRVEYDVNELLTRHLFDRGSLTVCGILDFGHDSYFLLLQVYYYTMYKTLCSLFYG